MKNRILMLAFLVLSVLITSCAGYKDYKGASVLIKLNEESVIRMQTDTNKAYSWIVSNISDPDIAKYTGKEFVSEESNAYMRTQIIKIKGLKKGKTIITLNYVKEGDLLVKKSRTYNVTVY